jgi:hypothetical protein
MSGIRVQPVEPEKLERIKSQLIESGYSHTVRATHGLGVDVLKFGDDIIAMAAANSKHATIVAETSSPVWVLVKLMP